MNIFTTDRHIENKETKWLIKLMGMGATSEAKSFSASPEISRILCTLKIPYPAYKSPPIVIIRTRIIKSKLSYLIW
jgi:hypothetical protein